MVRLNALDPTRLRASILEQSYWDFVRAFWPAVVAEKLVPNWHLPFVCGEIQDLFEPVFADRPKEYDLIDNQPPGTSKSLLFSVFALPWAWTRMPSFRMIGASYSYPLAMHLSRLSRDVVQSELYQTLWPHLDLRKDQNTKAFFANRFGGTRYAVGSGGSVTGMHAHAIVIDDPLDPNEAASDAELARTNFWISKTLLSRKVSKVASVVALVMQRLHEGDPTQMFLDRGGCRHVRFPAKLGEGTEPLPRRVRRYYKSGYFDPVRLPEQVLAETRKEMGDVAYCTPGFSPILMADFTEKPIEDVRIGDRVVGFVSEPQLRRGKPETRIVKSRVTAVSVRSAKVVRLGMASGRSVYCTPDHQWWNRYSPGEVAAGKKRAYSAKRKGQRMYSVYQPLDDPDVAAQRDYDWLGGIIDGEGACRHAGAGINISQSHVANPDICREIGRVLRRLGIPFSRYRRDTYHESRPGGRRATTYHLASNRTVRMRLLKNCRLVKRRQIVKMMWAQPYRVAAGVDRVKRVHPVGTMTVYGLTTTTGNYVVWGFASKNCGQYAQNPVPPGGAMFDVTQIALHPKHEALPKFTGVVRFWDNAATTEKEDSRAAYTTGVKLALTETGETYVLDVKRGRWNTGVRERVKRTEARRDGPRVAVGVEQEPGSGGKESAAKTKRMLRGHRVYVIRPAGDKVDRARPFSVEVNMGRVVLGPEVGSKWHKDYLKELAFFPYGRYKDQVDASAGAHSVLENGLRRAGGIKGRDKPEETVLTSTRRDREKKRKITMSR